MAVNTTTRAYELTGFELTSIKESARQLPALGAHEVLVKMHAASLNYRDYMIARGVYNRNLKLPLVPLSDGAGEVIDVGNKVTRVRKGDRVMPAFMQGWLAGEPNAQAAQTALGGAIDGVAQNEAIFNEEGLVHIPENLSYEEAATLPCAALTAWNALFESNRLRPGSSVLTLGTGGVSLFALQFAKAAGATVVITSSSDQKLERAKKFGADILINYKQKEAWDKEILASFKSGVDQVIELGGAGTLDRSAKSVRMGGTISLIGVLAAGTFNPVPILMKAIRLQGIFVGSREMFEHMTVAIATHKIKPVIDKSFSITELSQALEYMGTGSHFGKIVLRF